MLNRKKAVDFIKAVADEWRPSNEIMFRQGVPKEHFTGIVCPNESWRATLLEKLKEAGITEINGVPVEDFVKVGETI